MNLYLISQRVKRGYDTYDSAVVAAETEELARETYPNGQGWPDSDYPREFLAWAPTPKKVQVKLIGKAIEGTKAGVICASFNSG